MRAHRGLGNLVGAKRRAGDDRFRDLAIDLLPRRARRIVLDFAGDVEVERKQIDAMRLGRGADEIAAPAKTADQTLLRQQFERALDRPAADAQQRGDRPFQQNHALPELAVGDVAREFVAHELIIRLAGRARRIDRSRDGEDALKAVHDGPPAYRRIAPGLKGCRARG
jgi:hypothetical protein